MKGAEGNTNSLELLKFAISLYTITVMAATLDFTSFYLVRVTHFLLVHWFRLNDNDDENNTMIQKVTCTH